ncbi:MAG: hypothetical protein JXA20_05610 [Spirochaetes bacterium]|nr:hypothetical protein [Spirochaetota bacterium]
MRLRIMVFCIVPLSFILACSSQSGSNNYPYKFVNSKIEDVGNNNNKMDLFAFSGKIDVTNLKDFCKTKKNNFKSGTFYFVVIFDDSKNAVFPNSPFTADYGIEEAPQKHIRAYYVYNRVNGYSKLDYYEKNKWESSAISEDIK